MGREERMEAVKVFFMKFVLGVWGSSSERDVTLEREMDLPLTPFPGLSVTDGYFEGTITEVAYDVQEGRLECWTESDTTIPDTMKFHSDHPRVQEIVSNYLEKGWRIQR